jgi:hypothetical protein
MFVMSYQPALGKQNMGSWDLERTAKVRSGVLAVR